MDQIFSALARHFGLNDQESENFSALKNKVLEVDTSFAEALVAYKQASDAMNFLNKDHEMRFKIPDIWKMQCTTTAQTTILKREHLLEYFKKFRIQIHLSELDS